MHCRPLTCLSLGLLGALFTHAPVLAQPVVSIRKPVRAVAELGGNLLVGTEGGFLVNSPAFLFDATTGVLLQTFADPGSGDFGISVASVGGNALIGASSTAAYLFDSGTGALVRTFPTPAGTEIRFGHSVAALGSNVLVGAPGGYCCSAVPGAVYLFDGATATLLRTFQAPTPAVNDGFGYSVAALGSNVLIGAPGLGSGPGAAYLFDGATGGLLQTFVDPSPPAGDRGFGFSVAAAGGNALVGDPEDDTLATDGGAAHLFDASTGSLIRSFASPTPTMGARFGAAIAAYGGHVLIAPNYGIAAVVFDSATGAVARTLFPPTSGGTFAGQVAFAQGHPVVGGLFASWAQVYCGGALGCGPCETCGPAGSCVIASAPTCQARIDGRMRLRIINRSTSDAGDLLSWAGSAVFDNTFDSDAGMFGLPTEPGYGHDYTLCLYDQSSGPPNLLFRATAPAGGTCGSRPCWEVTRICENHSCGFAYRDTDATPDGVGKMTLREGNRLALKVKGVGENLSNRPGGLPAMPLPLPLRVQLQAREGFCWEADYSAAPTNTQERFRASAD
jgi:DNA-binding beta-propeller fold protein YncE